MAKPGELLSVTQLETYEDCERKWYYKHVLKYPEKGSPALEYGSTGHEHLQRYRQTGELPPKPDIGDAPYVELHGAGKMFIYPPDHPKIREELPFVVNLIAGSALQGRVDVLNESGIYINELGQYIEDGHPEVLDYKFSGNPKYWKTASDLRRNIQMMGYAGAMLRGAAYVRVSHLYLQSKAPRDARKVTTLLRGQDVDRFWAERLEPLALGIQAAAKIEDVRRTQVNLATCTKYLGCSYAAICTKKLSDKELYSSLMMSLTGKSGPTTEPEQNPQPEGTEEPKMSIMGKLMKGAGVPNPDAAPAPAAAPKPPAAPAAKPPAAAAPATAAKPPAAKPPTAAAATAASASGVGGKSLLGGLPKNGAPAAPAAAKPPAAAAPKAPPPPPPPAEPEAEEEQETEATRQMREQMAQSEAEAAAADEAERQAQAAADLESPDGGAQEAPAEAPAAGKKRRTTKAPSTTSLTGKTRIFVGCMPGGGASALDDYIHALCAKIEGIYDVYDIRLGEGNDNPLSFGKWDGVLAAAIREFPPPEGDHFVFPGTDRLKNAAVEAVCRVVGRDNWVRAL